MLANLRGLVTRILISEGGVGPTVNYVSLKGEGGASIFLRLLTKGEEGVETQIT